MADYAKPTRTFSADVGDLSTGTAGPDAIETDIDAIDTMFDPTIFHSDGVTPGGIHTENIADEEITTAKIADSNVTTAKIADSNVTTDKIADSNVTTDKIADDAVTADKVDFTSVTYSEVGAAPSAQGVTNGDSHDHSGGDGAQISHTTLSNIGTNTHATIDDHIDNFVRHTGYATTAGTLTAYTLTLTPVPTTYIDGFSIAFKVHTTCGNSPTINVNSLGAKSLRTAAGTVYSTGDLISGRIYSFRYNGTYFLADSSTEIVGYFGDGSDGAFNSTGNVTYTVSSPDNETIIKQYTSFTLNSGHTLSVTDRCQGLIIYVQGNVSISGTIDMDYMSAYIDPETTNPVVMATAVQQLYYPFGDNAFILIGPGGYGGQGGNGGAKTSAARGVGGAGQNGFWFGGAVGGGGGGGGAYDGSTSLSSTGGTGGDAPTSTTGASGGTAPVIDKSISSNTTSNGNSGSHGSGGSGSAVAIVGSGTYDVTAGNGGSSTETGAGGGGGGTCKSTTTSGNGSNGSNGTGCGGGLIAIIAEGNITISSSGIIQANGGNGGNGGSGYSYGADRLGGRGGGGGGSGGGIVAMICQGTYTNSGTITVSGGSGGSGGTNSGNTYSEYTAENGADGGAGRIIEVEL